MTIYKIKKRNHLYIVKRNNQEIGSFDTKDKAKEFIKNENKVDAIDEMWEKAK